MPCDALKEEVPKPKYIPFDNAANDKAMREYTERLLGDNPQRQCVRDAHKRYTASLKGVAVAPGVDTDHLSYTTLFDPEAIQWYKKSQKVGNDMKKSGCPYE
jgi:hypothetical protein